jgi:nuclear pore complex protein Nup53
MSFNMSGNVVSPSGGGSAFATPMSPPRHRDLGSVRGKEKAGAPPTSGLLEQIGTPAPGSNRKLDLNQSRGLGHLSTSFAGGATPGSFHQSFHHVSDLHSTSILSPGVNTSQMLPKKTPPSPAQVDPFYTQGEHIQADDVLDEAWVTVFGFPPSATSFVLQQFSQYGNIIKHVVATSGNWMHLHYQSKLQAKKALSKNGKVFGSSIMVGVSPCIDKSVMEGDYCKDGPPGIVSTPTSSLHQSVLHRSILNQSVDGLNTSRGPIRPLTASYRAASSDHEVMAGAHTPKKNSGFITKAMEYMFGW